MICPNNNDGEHWLHRLIPQVRRHLKPCSKQWQSLLSVGVLTFDNSAASIAMIATTTLMLKLRTQNSKRKDMEANNKPASRAKDVLYSYSFTLVNALAHLTCEQIAYGFSVAVVDAVVDKKLQTYQYIATLLYS